MNTEIPVFVSRFLSLSKQLRDIRELEKKCKEELCQLQPQVGGWLHTVPKYEVPLDFTEEHQRLEFGSAGKLRFGLDKRMENINKTNLTKYLYIFFGTVYTGKPDSDIMQLAVGAATSVWGQRQIVNKPVVKRTFAQIKRKRAGT